MFDEWTHEKYLTDMMTFHLNPSVEVFDRIVQLAGPLYKESIDLSEERYIELEGETTDMKRKRLEYKKTKQKKHQNNPYGNDAIIQYTDEFLLSWIYAAFKTFPWLLEKCEKPLYAERADRFDATPYHNLVYSVQQGPKPVKNIDDDSSLSLLGHRQHKIDNNRQDWLRQLTSLAKHVTIRFGASGDLSGLNLLTHKLSNDPVYKSDYIITTKHVENTLEEYGFHFDKPEVAKDDVGLIPTLDI